MMKTFSGLFLVLGFGMAAFSLNPIAWALSIAAITLFLSRFLRIGEFPIGLMAFAIPVIEIVTSLLNVELSGLTLNQGFGAGGEKAYILSIVSFTFFMLGFFVFGNRDHIFRKVEGLNEALADLSMRKLVSIHLILHGLVILTRSAFGFRSALFQIVLHFQKFPLLLLYVIAWKFAVEKKSTLLVFSVFLVNLAVRLTGFFSEWKELLFLGIFVAIGASEKLNAKAIRRLMVLSGVGFAFLLTWQGVKMEYRQFLNGGRKSQAVVVDASAALEKLWALAGDFWLNDDVSSSTASSLESTLDRLGYLEFFAKTVEEVPRNIDHEHGQLLLDNLSFALIPRILNPNKGVKNDQWKVEYYANRPVSDHSSFSLGRYAEWYVDFGAYGMMLMAFLVGGLGAKLLSFMRLKPDPLLSLIDAAYFMLTLQLWTSYQADEIKIYGQTFWGIIVYVFFGRTMIRWFIQKRLTPRMTDFSKNGRAQKSNVSTSAD